MCHANIYTLWMANTLPLLSGPHLEKKYVSTSTHYLKIYWLKPRCSQIAYIFFNNFGSVEFRCNNKKNYYKIIELNKDLKQLSATVISSSSYKIWTDLQWGIGNHSSLFYLIFFQAILFFVQQFVLEPNHDCNTSISISLFTRNNAPFVSIINKAAFKFVRDLCLSSGLKLFDFFHFF